MSVSLFLIYDKDLVHYSPVTCVASDTTVLIQVGLVVFRTHGTLKFRVCLRTDRFTVREVKRSLRTI